MPHGLQNISPLTGDWAWAIAMKAWILTSRLEWAPVSSLKPPVEKLSLLLALPKSMVAQPHPALLPNGCTLKRLRRTRAEIRPSESESGAVSHVWLFVTLWTVALPGSSVHGVFQARILEWVAISFFRGSSPPRDWTRVSLIADRLFTVWATRWLRN